LIKKTFTKNTIKKHYDFEPVTNRKNPDRIGRFLQYFRKSMPLGTGGSLRPNISSNKSSAVFSGCFDIFCKTGGLTGTSAGIGLWRRFFRKVQNSVQNLIFSLLPSSYHLKAEECKNLRAFDFFQLLNKNIRFFYWYLLEIFKNLTCSLW